MKWPVKIGAIQDVKSESRATPRSDAWRFLIYGLSLAAMPIPAFSYKDEKRIHACLFLLEYAYGRAAERIALAFQWVEGRGRQLPL